MVRLHTSVNNHGSKITLYGRCPSLSFLLLLTSISVITSCLAFLMTTTDTKKQQVSFIMQCNTFINFFIAVCELNQDLAILPNGDATEIGERYFQIQIINLNTNIILA